ncbi:hypothetical protein Y032_0228g2882 [Ancylostoma ceylanicum]|uniref:Fucosyltransferase n=2 Tax=Ancylostoma ceylanicum TaxID=53326 RepID=A0A016SHG8_9BILA|nr:hypothetical protein Y032_0228g2882 [Ancylostoma ceylanicum]
MNHQMRKQVRNFKLGYRNFGDYRLLNDGAKCTIVQSTPGYINALSTNQYLVFYSQESPIWLGVICATNTCSYNMSLGFRHDSPIASPYGYTVKLAETSRSSNVDEVVNIPLIYGKTKGAAWFVSNCHTYSSRETYVAELQKVFQVDQYGSCGPLKCERRGACEAKLDTE